MTLKKKLAKAFTKEEAIFLLVSEYIQVEEWAWRKVVVCAYASAVGSEWVGRGL